MIITQLPPTPVPTLLPSPAFPRRNDPHPHGRAARQGGLPPFVKVAALPADAGLAAPHPRTGFDQGFLVTTDLGRIGYLEALPNRPTLADASCVPSSDILVQWQSASRPDSSPTIRRCCVGNWICSPSGFVSRHLGHALSDDEGGDRVRLPFPHRFRLAQRKSSFTGIHAPQPDGRRGAASLVPGILDFQDAVSEPIAYDVVPSSATPSFPGRKSREIDWV